MPEIIQDWLGTRLGIVLDLSPQKFGRNTKDGTILAKLLYSYGVIPRHVLEKVQETKNYHDCYKNLMELKPWLNHIGVKNEDSTLLKMAGGEGSAAISIFYSVFLNLERRDRLYYISAQKERRPSDDSCQNRFKVDWVPEKAIREGPEEEISKYAQPLLESRDLIDYHKEKCKEVVNMLKDTKKKFEKMMNQATKADIVIPKHCEASQPVDRRLAEAEETKEGIIAFEKKFGKPCVDFTYSQLIELKKAEGEPPCFPKLNIVEAENIINSIRGRKRREIYAKNFLQKMQHLALEETWREITEKQDKDFESTICEFLLKQSQYEKQMAGKLHLIRKQKKVLANNRRMIECLKLEQGEKEFDDLVEGKMEVKRQYWEEEEFEKKRIAELHRRLYYKKVKWKRMANAYEVRMMCEALVDVAIRVSEARAVTACHLPKFFVKDLKELFYKGFPIFDILDNFEELCVKSPCLSEGDRDQLSISCPEEELEKLKKEESERQIYLDECDFNDYLNLSGLWAVDIFFPDGSETEPKQAVLGHVVHQLLASKYVVQNLPLPVLIKAMKPTAVVLEFNDDSACKMLEDLMETRGIMVARVDDAINFVLSAYKEEMSVVTDIDINIRKATANAFTDKKGCDQEKVKKKIRLLKKGKPERETSMEKEHSQLTKETQTPRQIPEGLPELSPNAVTGKLAFEALSVGDPVPDPVIVPALVAYVVSKQDNYDGWVLLNYPVLYSQACALEYALRGFLSLPVTDDMMSLEEAEGFNFREWCENPSLNHDSKNHLSRLVPQPKTPEPPPDQTSKTYFDVFVAMRKIGNSQEGQKPDQQIEKFYSEQDVFFNFEYPTLNFESVKSLGKMILAKVNKEEELAVKTSVEIFGNEILRLNEKWMPKKKTGTKSKEKSSKKGAKEGLSFRIVETPDVLGEVKAEESSAEKKVLPTRGSEAPLPPPAPGDPDWEWATGSLPKQIQLVLASLWESMEAVYVEDFQDVFFLLRVHRSKLLSYCGFVRQSTKALMRGPDDKQRVLSDFQNMFNEMDEDLRPDVDVKCELHVRVTELEQALMTIADERRTSFLNDLKKIATDSWVADEMANLVNSYLTAVQLEVDRCVDTCQVIMDYYQFLQQKAPDGEPIAKVSVPKLYITEGRYSTKSGLLNSPRNSDSRRSSKTNFDKITKTRSWMDKKKPPPETTFLPGAAEAICHILSELTLPRDGLTPFHIYFLDVGDSVLGEARKVIESCLSEVKRGEKPAPRNTKKNSDAKPPVNANLNAEWISALDTEFKRFAFRLKLILAKGLFEMNEFLMTILNVISSLSDDIADMYLKEVESIAKCCKVFRCGIEEEIGIQPQLELRAEEFIVNQDVLLFPNPQKTVSSSLEDEQRRYRFTIEQLTLLFHKLQHVAPEGEIVKRALIYIFEDLRTLNLEIENGNCCPEVWYYIEPEDVIEIFNAVYQELEIVHWKDFIICAMDLPIPTEAEILLMRKMFRSYDPNVAELISRENYDSVKFWFETTLDYYTKADRCEKAKDLLFRMYQADEHKTNYSALLLAFCKDENPVVGFTKALALVMGKKIGFKDTYYDHQFLEGEAEEHYHLFEEFRSGNSKKIDASLSLSSENTRKSSPKDFKLEEDNYPKSSTEEGRLVEEEKSLSENLGEQASLYRYDFGLSRRSSLVFYIPYDTLTALFKASYPSLPQLSLLLDCKQTFEETLNSLYDSIGTPENGVEVVKLVQHNFVSRLLQSTNKFKFVKISRILMEMAAIKNDQMNCFPDKLNFKFCAGN